MLCSLHRSSVGTLLGTLSVFVRLPEACMSQLTPTTGPAFVGKASGSVPNLFWRRISLDQLRSQPQYQALPSVEHLTFERTADFRKVRQESQLWTDLHRGLLTTGKLNAALGFYEPAAAKRLGIPRDRVNHNSLLSAAANLQLPSYGLQLLDLPAAPVISLQPSTNFAPRPPGLENAITVSEYEAAAIKLANAACVASGTITKSKHARLRRQKQRQEQQQHQQAAAATQLTTAAGVTAPGQAEASLDPYGTDEAKRNRCLTVAARGEGGLRMAWGSTQEAAASFSVIHLFPTSQLQEVGLCWVDPASQIPKAWGFQPEDLPPLGASPDGLIRHKPPPPPPGPPSSLARSHPTSDAHVANTDSAHGSHHSASVSATAAAEAPVIGPAQNCGTSSSEPQSAAAQHAQQPPQQAALAHAPSLSELEALLAKLDVSWRNPYSSTVQSVSISNSAAQTHAGLLAYNSQLNASSTSTSATGAPSLSASAAAFTPGMHPKQPVTTSRSTGLSSADASDTSGDTPVSDASLPGQDGCQGKWLEAVEIKNVCPFREARDVSSSGKSRRLYRLSDPGPYSRVPCHFVPQLQMEMLASGANSALVVSRSATKGVRVFRMQRHAEFLQQMLHTISQMYTKYVKRSVQPPQNMFFEQPAYQQFLRTTQHVAASVEVVIDSEVQALPDVKDNRMFL